MVEGINDYGVAWSKGVLYLATSADDPFIYYLSLGVRGGGPHYTTTTYSFSLFFFFQVASPFGSFLISRALSLSLSGCLLHLFSCDVLSSYFAILKSFSILESLLRQQCHLKDKNTDSSVYDTDAVRAWPNLATRGQAADRMDTASAAPLYSTTL